MARKIVFAYVSQSTARRLDKIIDKSVDHFYYAMTNKKDWLYHGLMWMYYLDQYNQIIEDCKKQGA